jgi:CDP-diacylglycerol--serine O-phosphatidyltransferase|mmetsp:Transcript_39283/g.62218  ORF Transcript_39283/g.62218 Transcript_39283/m.62218 type:complete len:407 (+) Transcript_39283:75-1295(+)|eukprot:CAMPEP_0169123972 /NCGR_PEP_ID=MMETSP1015-20121227/34071_1 /TAXON_ID=342587 /ORGANISM="Karlodinium micrum, Strain CCMP2283" /LENGTH=406 /DNA_ID=CAMNT_0009187347 /DNA_START=71 /DNA_END=1291 /DNA_ORIENTATION=+
MTANVDAEKPTFPTGPFYKAQMPNFITCIVVAAGCVLMVSTSVPGFSPEVTLIAAGIGLTADMLDGFAARALKATSKFGAAFDQLADLCCFGIGPAVFFIRHQMAQETNYFALFAGFAFMACAAARIARELVVHNITKPEFFVGIPTNLACPILLGSIYDCPDAGWLPVLALVLSALMVMPVEIPKDLGTGLLKKEARNEPESHAIKRDIANTIFPQGPIYKAQAPNLVTCIVIVCGCSLMASTSIPGFTSELSLVAAAIGLGADILDGFVARSLNATSKFGAAFDQLADLTCFGIGPAVFFIRHQMEQGFVLSALVPGYLYMVCAAARIARELVVHNIGKPTFFVGIPTNLACPILLSVVYALPHAWWLPLVVVALSAMMVMPVKIPKDLGTGLLTPVDVQPKSA